MIFYRKEKTPLKRAEHGQKLTMPCQTKFSTWWIKPKISNYWKRELTRPPRPSTEVLPISSFLPLIPSHLKLSSIYHFCARIKMSHTSTYQSNQLSEEPVVFQEILLLSQFLPNQMVQLIVKSKKWKIRLNKCFCENLRFKINGG